MKILHISPSYKPAYIYGGPIISISQLCETQSELGHKVVVYTTTANGNKEIIVQENLPIEVDGVEVWYFSRATGDHTHISPKLWNHLWRTVRQFDAVHIHSWWSFLVLGSVFICWIKRIKPFLSVRGMLTDYSFKHKNSFKKKLIHFLIGRFLLKKTFLHATTTLEWNICQEIIPNWRGFIAPNLILLPKSQNTNRSENKIFKIGTLSRLDPVKGIDILIKALTKVDFQFLLEIAGSGSEEYELKLKELIEQNQLNSSVKLIGWQGSEIKNNFLQSLDLLAVPSHTENFSVSTIEALALGTPVLVSDQVGLFDMVAVQKWGWVSELSKEKLAVQLNLAYEEKFERIRIRREAPEQVRRIFEKKSVAEQYIKAYNSML